MSKRDGWDISAVLWEDACTSIDNPGQGIVPTLSFGVAVPDGKRRAVRVVHDFTALAGGSPGVITAIPRRGMVSRVIFLARLPIPEEFKKYWGECESS
jgi:hypothetical protein